MTCKWVRIALVTVIHAAEKIQLALLERLIVIVALCTLVTTTPDATLNTHVAVSLLAHSVLTEAI